jgi:hypothetical protein
VFTARYGLDLYNLGDVWFDPGPIHVRFAVDKVALGQVLLR